MFKVKLDRSRAFGTVSSSEPNEKRCTSQDGIFFGADDTEVGKSDGFHMRVKREAAAEEQVKAAAKVSAAQAAADILGDLGGDPHAEASRENRAAAAAEALDL